MCLDRLKKTKQHILSHSWRGKAHIRSKVKSWLIIWLFLLSPADTWRSMRKSITSAKMTKNRSRGIPKPLFQSVQFPTLITTSNTLYQVSQDIMVFRSSLCVCLCLSHARVSVIQSHSVSHFSLWSLYCLFLYFSCWPFEQLKDLMLTQKSLQQSITSSELCMRCMRNWSARMSTTCIKMCLNISSLFQGLSR